MLSHLSPPKMLFKVILKQNHLLQNFGENNWTTFSTFVIKYSFKGQVTAVDVLYGGYCSLHGTVVHHSLMSQRVGGQTEESLLIELWGPHLGKPVMVGSA